MAFGTLTDVYTHRISELRDIEVQLIQTLPVLADAASSEALSEAFTEHLEETRRQLERLDAVLAEAGDIDSRLSQPIRAMVAEAGVVAADDGDPVARDVALVGAAQELEHYEIAAYGTARAIATELGLDGSADLLGLTLAEELAADERLTSIAQGGLFSDGLHQRAAR